MSSNPQGVRGWRQLNEVYYHETVKPAADADRGKKIMAHESAKTIY